MDIETYLVKTTRILESLCETESGKNLVSATGNEIANNIIVVAILSEMRNDERLAEQLKKQTPQPAPQEKPKEEMATPKQKEWLKKNNVPGYDKMTKAQAHAEISERIAQERGY